MSSSRYGWMDALRGAAILFVIFGHAVQLAAMYSGHDFTRMSAVVGVLGPLRMPLLFFLSGMLVPRSLVKGARVYFRGKMAKILYPYLLWSILLILACAVFATVITWWSVPPVWDILISPIEHLWFLAYLLVYYVVAYVARTVNPLWVVLVATLLMTVTIPGEWARIADMAVPFFLGAAFTRYQDQFQRIFDNTKLCAALLAAAVLAAAGGQAGLLEMPSTLSWTIPIMLAFFVGIIGVMQPIGQVAALRPLRYIGRESLVFYLVHWPVMMFLVAILATKGVRSPWGLFWISLTVGLIVSTAIAFLNRRMPTPFSWLFTWPLVARTKSRASAPAV